MSSGLDVLPPLAREVFARRYGTPTPAQDLAWPAIVAGESALVVAPTGSGKTLAAFYAFLAELCGSPPPERGVEVLYISPLKALAVDVEKNLREPLAALRAEARAQGVFSAPVPVAVRSGDTPSAERAAMRRRPPRILVTTPESLYLILTSHKARAILETVRAVIVDEVHALLPTKRGVHLALSLERLERLTPKPPQRIGLSATVAPVEEAAAWLGGKDDDGRPRPVRILEAWGKKALDLQVVAPLEVAARASGPGGVWPHVARFLVELAARHRSTLIFTQSRRHAERLTTLMNAHAGRELAHAHHGSVSRERRLEMEDRLKAGQLEALVATASLELGIDVGAIDLVVQVQSPKSVSRGLQRVGRAGHLVGATAKGRMVVTFRADALEAATVARGMLLHELEPSRSPERCLDVLAQQIVAEVAAAEKGVLSARELYSAFRRAHPYRALGWDDFVEVVEMLAGRWASQRDARPRLDWDRKRARLGALPGSRALAVARPGAIPDRGHYRVELEDSHQRIGELDEEFVFESRTGDAFVLGTTTWRIARILKDRVVVRPAATGEPARMPFWRGEGPGRAWALGARVGELCREIDERLARSREAAIDHVREACATDEATARLLVEHVAAEREATGVVPSDRRVVIEQYEDDLGEARVAILSPFGRRVNAAWAIALSAELRRRAGIDAPVLPSDDGILFRAPAAAAEKLLESARWLRAADAPALLADQIEGTALYGGLYREAAQRALIFGGGPRRGRTPLWLARQRAADLEQLMRGEPNFPVAREARREALEDVLDVAAFARVLAAIEKGEIEVVSVRRALPSPFASDLQLGFAMAFLYEGDSPRLERRARALAAGRDAAALLLPPEELEELIEPDAVADLEARRQHMAPGTRARTPEELAEVFRRLGDLTEPEVAARVSGDAAAALAPLLAVGRVVEIERAGVKRLVLDEDADLWRDLDQDHAAQLELSRRFAAAHGPFAPEDVVERYALSRERVEPILAELEADGILARGRFVKGRGTQSAQLCDRRNLAELHRRTLALLRDRGAPATPAQLASFLLARHRAADVPGAAALLAGVRTPWEVLERDLLRRRLRGYQPALLDAACATGQVAWWLEGGRAALTPREELAVWWEPGSVEDLTAAENAVLDALDRDGAQFGSDLLRSTKLPAAALFQALWSLARRGLVANDAWDALRRAAALDFEPTSADLHPANTVDALRRAVKNARPTPWVGRFARLSPMPLSHEERAARQAETLLRRYGVVGKAVADAEGGTVPWPLLEEALRRLELRGEAVRGFFVEGLGPYQLARADTVDELRAPRDPNELALVNACDPCLPAGFEVARLPSTYLVLRGGAPLLRVEAHGRRITPLAEAPEEVLAAGLSLLAELLLVPASLRAVRSVTVHKFGESDAAAAEPLFQRAGFRRDGDRMVLGILDAEKTLRR